MSETPNGQHYYFQHDEKLERAIRFLPELDLITNGYVVAPPSRVPAGNYNWLSFLSAFDTALQSPPQWIVDAINEQKEETSRPASANQAPRLDDSLTPGELISPLLKYDKKRDLEALEAPAPGERNQWLFEQALTHFNLGLSENEFRSIFFQKIWPGLDKQDNGNGRFTAREVSETIASARRVSDKFKTQGKSLPPAVINYHRYRPGKENKQTSTQPNCKRWSRLEVQQGIIKLLSRRSRSYHSGRDGGEVMHLLAEDVSAVLDRTDPVPRRTLCRALKWLRERGAIEVNKNREGTGHVLFELVRWKKDRAPMPATRINKVGDLESEKNCASAREESGPGESITWGKDPPAGPGELKKLLKGERQPPKYPELEKYRNNSERLWRKGPWPRQKVYHVVAWLTEDIGFTTWLYRNHSPDILWPVLRELAEHFQHVDNPGGWIRQRLKNQYGEVTG